MKALKITGVAVLLLILVIGGLIYYGLSNLDRFIKMAVEDFGSEAVGTEVTLRDVNVELQSGRIELLGLQVANPPGYTTDYAFALSQIAVQVQPGSLGADPIVVDEITIDGPSINAEERDLTRTNLTDLADNLKGDGAAEPEPEPASGEAADLPNIAVSRFQFSNADISLVSEQYGDRTINMPSFVTTDLGGSAGLPPDQLATALMDEVLSQATSAVKGATRDAAKQEVRERAKEAIDENLSDEDKEKLDDLRSRFQ